MLEKLGKTLKKVQDKILNAILLDKDLVDAIIKELQRALIEADVEILLVKKLSDEIKKTALDERIKGIEKKEHIIKILHDQLIKIIGESKKLELKKEQTKIMFLGLYGAGKTTTLAKLGNYYQKRGKKVALVGLDVHRPAAKEQLKQLADKNNLKVFVDFEEKDPIKTYKKFKKDLEKFDLILVDTAGRHTLDKELIAEIKNLGREIKPTETILVITADLGQAAKKQAKEFQDALNISGVIITRMDSTAKAGGALTACAETKAPVYFIATGEKINDLEEFNPKSFLSRLLGMGDLETLIEKVRLVTDNKKQDEIQKRLQEGKLSLEDVIEQVKSMNQIGGLDKIKSMIPGFGNVKVKEGVFEQTENKIAKWEHIIKSMTEEEKDNPEVLEKQTSRIARIARGAGVSTSDIRSLLKQYKMLQDMIKEQSSLDMSEGMSQRNMQKLMKKFGKKKIMRF
jgi:signal recognition particle subunit SRP54